MKRNALFLTLTAVGLVCGQAAAQAQQPARAAAQPAQQADATFTAWDADRNNGLSQQEFRNGWANLQRRMMADSLRAQFNLVDANKNGAIDASEYGNLVLIRRAGKAAPMLASFDANKDQRLQLQEYMTLVARLAPQN